MQPISYSAHQSYSYQGAPQSAMPPQQYPVYANCFDRLTTNGVIAEDLVGYITDVPSPYLQNYVAQRGWAPSLPGRVLPDPLPTAPPPAPMSVPAGSMPVYTDIPRASDLNPNTLEIKDKNSGWKKAALALLLTGLAVFGGVKSYQLLKNGGTGLRQSMSNMWHGFTNAVKTGFTKIGDFFKNLWNKIFHRTP